MPFLTEWSTFYVAIGSSAAALTGLTFVVITIVAGVERVRTNPAGLATFTTPTVIHFCSALYVSAVLLVPWHGVIACAVLLGLGGLYGVSYSLRVIYLTSRLSTETYVPDVEDWAWYGISPLLAYGAILTGAVALPEFTGKGLFAVAGGTLLLIFIGIRNSWDVVTYLTVIHPKD
jgi:hypothetical protein